MLLSREKCYLVRALCLGGVKQFYPQYSDITCRDWTWIPADNLIVLVSSPPPNVCISIVKWRGGFSAYHHRQFVKGGPLCQHHLYGRILAFRHLPLVTLVSMVLLTHSTFIFYPHMQVAAEHNTSIHVLAGLFPCHRTG